MILSSLVSGDPDGFIELDKNLARHVGEKNVEAFHKAAGDLVMEEMLSNSVIMKELANDHVIAQELGMAIHRFQARAHGLGLASESGDKSAMLFKTLLQAAGSKNVDAVRDILAGELLTNQAVNDRTMRNPVIMRELNAAVTKMFKERKELASKA